MGAIVGGLGVPHTPMFPFLVSRDGPECETAQLFGTVRRSLESLRPDVIVMFDTDHLNTFFFDNYPNIAIGVADSFSGPNDEPRGVPQYEVRSLPDLATHLRRKIVEAEYDPALVQQYTVDHSIIVPLHFLTPEMQIPVVPVFINGHLPPLPSARRCHRLGSCVAEAVRSYPQPLRVVIVGSGSFSLEVWGPRMAVGRPDGVPDPDWAKRLHHLIAAGDVDAILEEATEAQMLRAGNVGGELLNWIAMLGAVGPHTPSFLKSQDENGHAYGVWCWS